MTTTRYYLQPAGALLRQWREHRRLSRLDAAHLVTHCLVLC